eukprot:gene7773-biopygen7731
MQSKSLYFGPVTWSPSGSPSAVVPTGNATDGRWHVVAMADQNTCLWYGMSLFLPWMTLSLTFQNGWSLSPRVVVRPRRGARDSVIRKSNRVKKSFPISPIARR